MKIIEGGVTAAKGFQAAAAAAEIKYKGRTDIWGSYIVERGFMTGKIFLIFWKKRPVRCLPMYMKMKDYFRWSIFVRNFRYMEQQTIATRQWKSGRIMEAEFQNFTIRVIMCLQGNRN